MSANKKDVHNDKTLPKVAVLLAAFNGMEWIQEQINSILNQQHVAIDLYISVDLSSDKTYELCKNLSLRNSNVITLPYGIRYGGAGKNFYRLIKDVDFVKYDYISLADQDDIWMADKLSHGIKQLSINNAEAYSANVLAFWEDGRTKLIFKSHPQRKLDYLFEGGGPGCTYIFTTKAATLVKRNLNDFSELNNFIFHDWLLYAILRHNNLKWIIDKTPKMKYRQHSKNFVGANISIKDKLHRLNYILSGKAFESVILLIKVLNITTVELRSRKGIFNLAKNVRHLRRSNADQFYSFIALIIYCIIGPK